MSDNNNKSDKGGEFVPDTMIKIEIERIVNLVAGFGWSKVKEETLEGKVLLTLQKDVPVTEEP